ncbi:MAG: pantetheine-phosphate adenylyltransferase [Bacteroidales bacterium]|jgi:pantetheine-phosphate adenylyltransferase|nr:pantetheine-phosphate adenylyltransferase [Bacteroidales bacterium]
MKERIALFPGSFDPITKGHESIVLRALPLFDKIIVAIGENPAKKHLSEMFSFQQRLLWLKQTFANFDKIEIKSFSCLTIDFARQTGAEYILRGLRNPTDFQYESNIARINQDLSPEIETVFLMTTPEDAIISSSLVKEILTFGGDIRRFLPLQVAETIVKATQVICTNT